MHILQQFEITYMAYTIFLLVASLQMWGSEFTQKEASGVREAAEDTLNSQYRGHKQYWQISSWFP